VAPQTGIQGPISGCSTLVLPTSSDAVRFTFHAKNEVRGSTLPRAKTRPNIPQVPRVEFYKARDASVGGRHAVDDTALDFS